VIDLAEAKSRVKDFLAAHPLVDQLVATLAVLAWVFILADLVTVPEASRPTIYAGVATISGLAMAASTFVCSMTYQSGNILMAKVVQVHSVALRRNWVSIISSNLLTAVAPLVALAVDRSHSSIASAVTVYSLALLMTRFGRAIWWMQYTLFLQDRSFQIPPPTNVSIRADLRDGATINRPQ
jgi:hypothetical protein